MAEEDAMPELTAPASGVFLILMSNIKQCFQADSFVLPRVGGTIHHVSKTAEENRTLCGALGNARSLFSSALKVILKGLVDYILRSGINAVLYVNLLSGF